MITPLDPPEVRPFRDLAFIAALLGLAATPLLAPRGSQLVYSPIFVSTIWLVGLCVFAAWVLPTRRSLSGVLPDWRWKLARYAGIVVVMVATGVVVFYLPMREHFWGGCDDVCCINAQHQGVWLAAWDNYSRPMWGLGPWIGNALTPNRVDGYLWTASFMYLLNALLLVGIVRRLLPGEAAVAVAAGLLLLCHRGDDSRFFLMWTGIWYWTSLALLLLGTWLFLESGRAGNRTGLVVSCLAVGSALLGSEAGYPLAALAPVLLWLSGVRGGRFWVWTAAWTGTVAILAVRFLTYILTTHGSYQSLHTTGVLKNPEQLLKNLSAQTEPALRWVADANTIASYPSAAVLAAVMAGLAVLLAGRATAGGMRKFTVGVGVAITVAAAGLVAFLPFDYAFRTQFYTAPGQAALLAVAIGGLCRILGRRAGPVALASVVAVLAAIAATGNRHCQDTADRYVNFDKTVRVLRQVYAATANVPSDALIVLMTEHGHAPPLGQQRSIAVFSDSVFPAQVMCDDRTGAIGVKVAFLHDRVNMETNITLHGRFGSIDFPYEKLVLFRVTADGTVSLLRHLPDEVCLDERVEARYNPLAVLKPGPINEPRYIRYPSWVTPPKDVIDCDAGVVFGDGWGRPESADGRVLRWVEPGAELIVNPLDSASRTLQLELEAEGTGNCALEVRGSSGEVLTKASVHGHEVIDLKIPTDPSRFALITLAATADSPKGTVPVRLKAFAPSGTTLPVDVPEHRDVAGNGVYLYEKWCEPESCDGVPCRWLGNEAELLLGRRGKSCALLLDLGAGPGLGDSHGRLRATDTRGRVLAEVDIPTRDQVYIPVPEDLQRGAVVRLEVLGGGKITTSDPRALNALVYRCAWATDTDDITRGGLSLGEHWYPFETWQGQTFRWLNTGGELVVGGSGSELVLEIGSGPGLGKKPGRLRVVGPSGQELMNTELTRGRRKYHCSLPPDLPRGAVLRLEIDGGGQQTGKDPRVLNAQVFRCELTDPVDITSSKLRVGEHWYPYETWQGQSFRWLNTGGELVIRGSAGELVLDMDGGPGLGQRPCRLRIVGPGGQELMNTELNHGRHKYHCSLPPSLPRGTVLRLEIDGGGQTVPGDPRVLNAQVFRCELKQ
jgi:hypothetical protein